MSFLRPPPHETIFNLETIQKASSRGDFHMIYSTVECENGRKVQIWA